MKTHTIESGVWLYLLQRTSPIPFRMRVCPQTKSAQDPAGSEEIFYTNNGGYYYGFLRNHLTLPRRGQKTPKFEPSSKRSVFEPLRQGTA